MPELLCFVLLFYFAVAVGRMLVSQCRYNALCYTAGLIAAELSFKNPNLAEIMGPG
jgi:hypothetical protein